MILAGFIAFIIPFLLNIFADLNFYILSQTLHSGIGIALSAIIHGIVFGITMDVIDQKRLLKIDWLVNIFKNVYNSADIVGASKKLNEVLLDTFDLNNWTIALFSRVIMFNK